MTDPIVSNVASGSLVTSLQGQAVSSGLVTVFEIYLPDSGIGGVGEDKLYLHDGRNGTSDITWYSLINEDNFGSSSASHYSERTYVALPIESEGWEIRGTGSLPRPTVRMANINSYFNTYLADFDDLVGAKVIRRRTLEKYLKYNEASSGDNNPPVEFNRDVFYIERKAEETASIVEFELTSALDVEGIKLPRRSIIAARCPWKYKDTDQGGCDWPSDNKYTINSVEHTLYFDKDDTRITEDTSSPGSTEYTYWGRQDVQANRLATLYLGEDYTVGNYVEYQRPIGSLYAITTMTESATDEVTITVADSATAGLFTTGEYLIIKGAIDASWNHKNIPLYVKSNTGSTVIVETDSTATGTLSTKGYIQACRPTLYKCIVAHSITTSDGLDEIIKPTNVSYWEFGDVCGKRLSSCAKRFGHVPNSGEVIDVHVKDTNGVLQQGSGYTSVPTVGFTGGGGADAAATATVAAQKVTKFTITNGGSGYTSNPTVTISGGGGSGAAAEARCRFQQTDNVSLPFGGFPGAALY